MWHLLLFWLGPNRGGRRAASRRLASGYISLNWVDSDKGIAFEVHQVAQPPSRNSGHRGVWAVGRETTRHQDFPADCQLLDVQSSPGLKFKHMPDGLDVNAVRFGEMVGTHFSQDPYDVLESRTAPRFRTCESVLLLNLFQDASFARVHSMFEDKLHKVVVLENNFDKIGLEKIRGKICRLGSKPALLRRLGPCVTKEELESLHQKNESVTRIFEKMLLFF